MKDHFSKIFGINQQEMIKDEIKELNLNLIVPNPYQPRRLFDKNN